MMERFPNTLDLFSMCKKNKKSPAGNVWKRKTLRKKTERNWMNHLSVTLKASKLDSFAANEAS